MCACITSACVYHEAVEHHKAGDLRSAEAKYRQAVESSVGGSRADALHNLGALIIQLYGSKRVDEAIGFIKQAIELHPSKSKFRGTLGIAYEQCKRYSDAADAFERAHEKDPSDIKVLLSLARVLRELKRNDAAAAAYRKVVALQPQHPAAHYKLATVLRQLGRRQQAAASYREHLRLQPDDSHASFWLAVMEGNSAAACPEALVAGLFDSYADQFDDHLVNTLGYQTPQLLMELLLQAAAGAGSSSSGCRWQRCVDLGCGTGLMAPLLRSHVGWLEGVDLSAGMVHKARERGLYDVLDVAELVTYLQQHTVKGSAAAGTAQEGRHQQASAGGGVPSCGYDLLVAADVLVYIGDLQPLMQAAAAAAQPGAVLCFSTEQLQEDADGPVGSSAAAEQQGYAVQLTGRYVHSQRYLREVAAATGWQVVAMSTATLRKNGKQPVIGNLCVMKLR